MVVPASLSLPAERRRPAMIACVLNVLKAFLLTVLTVLKRLLCCLDRQKKAQASSSSSLPHTVAAASHATDEPFDDNWDNWDGGPSEIVVGDGDGQNRVPQVSDHIRAYRESLQRQKSEPPADADDAGDEAEEADAARLFADMEPKYQRQKRVYIGGQRAGAGGGAQSSRLAVQEGLDDPTLAMGGELADWDANAQGGWEPEDEDLNDVLREQRRIAKTKSGRL